MLSSSIILPNKANDTIGIYAKVQYACIYLYKCTYTPPAFFAMITE